jgi:hypothetical protein
MPSEQANRYAAASADGVEIRGTDANLKTERLLSIVKGQTCVLISKPSVFAGGA